MTTIDKPKLTTEEDFIKKIADWSYENEVRLIDYNISSDCKFLGIPLDIDSRIYSIYFGYSCSEQDKRTIYNILKNKGISFLYMSIDPNIDIYKLYPVPYSIFKKF